MLLGGDEPAVTFAGFVDDLGFPPGVRYLGSSSPGSCPVPAVQIVPPVSWRLKRAPESDLSEDLVIVGVPGRHPDAGIPSRMAPGIAHLAMSFHYGVISLSRAWSIPVQVCRNMGRDYCEG